jgi:hypothetical protein
VTAKAFPRPCSTRPVYAITLVGAFGVVGVVRRETGGDDFSNFRGLASRSPLLAGCMAVFHVVPRRHPAAWLDFSENSICSAPRYMLAQITRFFGSSRLASLAVSSRCIITFSC